MSGMTSISIAMRHTTIQIVDAGSRT
jgi:hypothetical protein